MSQKTNKPNSNTRRRALQTAGVVSGSVAAAKWSKPVIESVIVPAHAQTTEPETSTTEAPGLVTNGGGGGFSSSTS